jgi:hypothetical protein
MVSAAAGIYILMTIVSRYPDAFNYPVRGTPATRPLRKRCRWT